MTRLQTYYNPAPIRKDELVGSVFTKDDNTLTLFLAIFWA